MTVQGAAPQRWRGVLLGLAAVVGFWGVAVVLLVGAHIALDAAGLGRRDSGAVEHPLSIVGAIVATVATLAASAVFAKLERRPPLAFGLAGSRRFQRLGLGAAAGLAAMLSVVGVLWICGAIGFAMPIAGVGERLFFGSVWAVGALSTAGFEEMLFRGYPLQRLTEAVGFPVAVLLTSAVFGLAHMGNGLDGLVGLVTAGVIGALLAISVRLTGSLWWAIGFHAAWNWCQSYVVGAANSGLRAEGSLFLATPRENPLLSGGGAGPEGSLVVTATALMLLIVLTRRIARAA